jgi:hypothetical protein
MAETAGKDKERFPRVLYVYEPLENSGEQQWDGYASYEDAEEDDTVGVYELKYVARIKHEKRIVLVNEEDLKRRG